MASRQLRAGEFIPLRFGHAEADSGYATPKLVHRDSRPRQHLPLARGQADTGRWWPTPTLRGSNPRYWPSTPDSLHLGLLKPDFPISGAHTPTVYYF
jgi:hypothetical protein